MALGTLNIPVKTVERVPGFFEVIEGLSVERPDVRVSTGMFDVARRAVVRDIAVNTGAGGDSLGDRLVALEALFCRHALSRLMALLAVLQSFVFGMGGTQRSR